MSGRRLGAALALGVGLALIVDLLLQFALDAIRIQPSSVNWEAVLVSKAVWLLAASIAAAVAPWVSPIARTRMEWSGALQTAGAAMIFAPIIWTVATVLVLVTSVPWTQPSFYAEIVRTNGPWLMAGAALKAAARHVSD